MSSSSSSSPARACAQCGAPLVDTGEGRARRRDRRFCGNRCKVAAHRARLELEHLERRAVDEIERAELDELQEHEPELELGPVARAELRRRQLDELGADVVEMSSEGRAALERAVATLRRPVGGRG